MPYRLLLLMLALTGASTQAHAATAKCLLQVDGKTYINGPCPMRFSGGGDFTLGADDNKVGKYFATVSINKEAGNADGFWNGAEGGGNHAHDPLGTLTRKGACWSNARAKICAEK